MTQRNISGAEAIREALDLSLTQDPDVFLFGLGVDDPKRIFGTTAKLKEKFGPTRVMDCPLAENALTGIAIGAATMGKRPILVHQRLDFALLSLDQIINNAAKWHYMFAGQHRAPIVIRMIIGRGWGQGPQHSQSLQALFAHIPGLKVVMPATPADAKGLLLASIEDDSPVIYLEHRWLHSLVAPVSPEYYTEALGKAKVVKEGKDVTIVATSYMVMEAFRAAEFLSTIGIEAEVIDLRTILPWDQKTVTDSVSKTGRLIVADTGNISFGIGAEILAKVCETSLTSLKAAPARLGLPDCPVPTSSGLSHHVYPRSSNLIEAALKMMNLGNEALNGKGKAVIEKAITAETNVPYDVPNLNFTGPF